MAGRKCSVLNCKNSALTNKLFGYRKSFHAFPTDENLRKKWIDACQRKIINIFSARICSDHFRNEDYFDYSQSDDSRTKRLKPNVVPSLNLCLNLESNKLGRMKFDRELSNEENSKEIIEKKGTLSASDKENTKGTTKRKNIVRQNDDGNSNELLKNAPSTKGGSMDNFKEKLKKKRLANNADLKQIHIEKNNNKNSENAPKKRNSITNVSKGSKSTPKCHIGKNVAKRKISKIDVLREVLKQKMMKGNIDPVDDSDRYLLLKSNSPVENSENVKDITKQKVYTENCSNTKQSKKTSEECNVEDFKNNETLKVPLDSSVANIKKVSQNETVLDVGHLKEPPKQKTAVEYSIKDTTKKFPKRKGFMVNGLPKKKRIRLGKDDSEDSDESEIESRAVTNNISAINQKITYKSPSEMKYNADLLKYLNYLKEKQSIEQPVLFWADE